MKRFITYWWLVLATMLSLTSGFFAVLLFIIAIIRIFKPDFPEIPHE